MEAKLGAVPCYYPDITLVGEWTVQVGRWTGQVVGKIYVGAAQTIFPFGGNLFLALPCLALPILSCGCHLSRSKQ